MIFIIFLQTVDSLKKALGYSKRAEETSNLESDDHGCRERKRPHEKPARYEESSSSNESKLITYTVLY
jgi:hypothetical protein